MIISDYIQAAKLLNQFVHESKMERDWMYRMSFLMQKKMKEDLENAVWGTPIYDKKLNMSFSSFIIDQQEVGKRYICGTDPIN